MSPPRRRLPSLLLPQSLTRRMLIIALVWIVALLIAGGFALDRVLSLAITRNFDAQLDYALTAMIASAEIGPDGEVVFVRPLGDQRFSEPYSGLYWQVSSARQEAFRSRSLWDRALKPDLKVKRIARFAHTSHEFAGEPLRIVERDATLPGSGETFRFQVAERRLRLDTQIADVRRVLLVGLSVLGFGLALLAFLQTLFGLWPLRRIRASIAAVRSGTAERIPTDFPPEIAPLVAEINELLEHGERQAEAARLHAGNLAHALKTPLSVLIGEARRGADDLPQTVAEQAGVMRRQIDHHLARARAAGRRSAKGLRTPVWPSLEAIRRSVEQMNFDRRVVIDITGDRSIAFPGERQDLEEMVGNLVDNAALYGGGRVFVTLARVPHARTPQFELIVEDDGPGIADDLRDAIFERGVRLDTSRKGSGLGLAIVRDVAEIYGGAIALGRSGDLGGLCATLMLPACDDGKDVR